MLIFEFHISYLGGLPNFEGHYGHHLHGHLHELGDFLAKKNVKPEMGQKRPHRSKIRPVSIQNGQPSQQVPSFALKNILHGYTFFHCKTFFHVISGKKILHQEDCTHFFRGVRYRNGQSNSSRKILALTEDPQVNPHPSSAKINHLNGHENCSQIPVFFILP